jgi:stigma-specific protein Stig1
VNKLRSQARSLLFSIAGCLALACGHGSDGPKVFHTTILGVECVEGNVACGAECVRLESSSDHCGACDHLCADSEVCDLGSCRPRIEGCSSTRLLCGDDCVDSRSDREHCGECGRSCPAEATCETGSCACPGALIACGETCADLASDEQHCGSCDQRCVDSQSCEAGQCECPTGTELCTNVTLSVADNVVTTGAGEATCVDTASDSANCGSCGVQCGGGQVCQAGVCACPEGSVLCSDQCVDTSTDTDNCGACGQACSGGQLCDAGSCACPAGRVLCAGECVELQSDVDHCGSCGTACALGQGCTQGACQSGAPGEDGCQGLVKALSISQVSAYQTVESVIGRDGASVADPAPALVAARPTLFRVFVTPQSDWVQREVSGRLFLANGDTEATLYSTSTLSPAAASQQSDRQSTFEFTVPAADIAPDTRFALELVECDGDAPGAVSNARFPASDAAELNAIDTGGLRIHIVPLRANGQLPDTSDTALGLYSALFLDSYPISNIDFTVGDPLDIADAEDWNQNLDSVRALRQRDNPPAEVYYYGMLKPAATLGDFCGNGCIAGVGFVPGGRQAAAGRAAMGLAFADVQSAFIMLHEVGHNHGRQHAPCVPQGAQITGVDPNYPQGDGSTGVTGYNALGDQLLGPNATDLMGYCDNQWLSTYTYQGLLDTVMNVNRVQASEIVDPARIGAWRVLLSDAAHGLRWGHPISGPAVAMGGAESASILDAAGQTVQTVTVYRTQISDLDAFSIQVPQPQPGWAAIQLAGAAPLAFPSPL